MKTAKKITINGKEYEYDFSTIGFKEARILENQYELSYARIQDKICDSVNSMVAYVMKCPIEKAEAEIDAHINGGGYFEDFLVLLTDLITDSSFFHRLGRGK